MAAKRYLNTEEAAAYLEISTDDLMHSRHRGLPPGIGGFTKDGVLVWDRRELVPPPKPRAPRKTTTTSRKKDASKAS